MRFDNKRAKIECFSMDQKYSLNIMFDLMLKFRGDKYAAWFFKLYLELF